MTNILLKNSTVAGKVPLPIDLQEGEMALNSADGKAFMKMHDGTVKTLGAGSGPVITPWVRNPTWLPMPNTTSAQEQVDLLVAVYPESSYIAFTCSTSNFTQYTVDWGDGSAPVNVNHNVAAQYLYDYNSPGLTGSNGPVTFTDSTDTVNRVTHGYTNGMTISFASIVTTTGIVQLQTYYVVNATANTFQLSATSGGSVLPLTNDGTGAILPYKQAMVKITPLLNGVKLDGVSFQIKNTTANLQAYTQPILDATVSMNGAALTLGGAVVPPRLLERCTILRHGMNSTSSLFLNCSSLQSVPLFNTANVTNMSSMFNGCSSLQSVPLFVTNNVTNMSSMFNGCSSLQSVLLFNTANVTNMLNMFTSCSSLQSVPLFNMIKVTDTTFMFQSCSSLQSVPLFNTANVTNMSNMFTSCSSLQSVPLFNTANVTTMGSMFLNCSSLQSSPSFNTPVLINTTIMFSGCSSLKTVALFDTSNVTQTQQMFLNCTSLETVPLFNFQNVVTLANSVPGAMFNGCTNLKSVPLFNTIKVTSFQGLFNGCTNLKSVPAFDTTAASGTNAFTQMFNGCSSLQEIPDMNFNRAAITTSASYNTLFSSCQSLSKINLSPGNGPKFTFTVASCKLSAASLNQLYTSLPTVTGQTITVTGNVGIAGDDPTIATAKGWTVTGS